MQNADYGIQDGTHCLGVRHDIPACGNYDLCTLNARVYG